VVQQQVLGLQVPVHDVAAVAEVHRRHDLLELLPGVLLRHAAVGHQVVYGERGGVGQKSAVI